MIPYTFFVSPMPVEVHNKLRENTRRFCTQRQFSFDIGLVDVEKITGRFDALFLREYRRS